MTAARNRPARLASLVLLLAVGCGPPGSPAVVPVADDLGSALYDHGRGPTGEAVTATLGDGSPLPAAAAACANCHGADGRGRPEGGIAPTDITWGNLTKPYGGTRPGGGPFPAYTEKLFVRAVTLGLDSAGRPLAPTMPRYQLTHEQAAALAAHVRRLGDRTDPGVTPTDVKIGLLTPAGRPGGPEVRRVVEAYFAGVSVNGRRVRLVAADVPAGSPPEWVGQFLAREPVFALVGGLMDGMPAADAAGVPVVGLIGSPDSGPSRAFQLFSGPADQCRVLAAVVPSTGGRAIVGGNLNPSAAVAVREGWKKVDRPWTEVDLAADGASAEAVVEKLRHEGVGACLIVAPASAARPFVRTADRVGWHPDVFAPAAVLGSEVAACSSAATAKWTLAFPSLRTDHTPAALAEYAELAKGDRLSSDHRAVQLAALAAAKLVVEALNRVGRELTREKLVAVLEGGAVFPTGLTPPLRFGPNRRVGARGAYLARPTADPDAFAPLGGWHELP